MRRVRLLGMLLALLAFAPVAVVSAQATAPADSGRLRVDAFIVVGYGSLTGGVSQGGSFGSGGAGGLGFERALGERVALRVEAFGGGSTADIGPTGTFSLPTTVIVNHAGVGVGLRRYTASRSFVGAGLSAFAITGCDVDTEGGPGFLGGTTESCRGFDEIALRPRRALVAANAAAGLRLRRWTLGLRTELGLQPSVDSDDGAMRMLHAGLLIQYHFGRQ